MRCGVEHAVEGEAGCLACARTPETLREDGADKVAGGAWGLALAEQVEGDGEESRIDALRGKADAGDFDPTFAVATAEADEAVASGVALAKGAVADGGADTHKDGGVEGEVVHGGLTGGRRLVLARAKGGWRCLPTCANSL